MPRLVLKFNQTEPFGKGHLLPVPGRLIPKIPLPKFEFSKLDDLLEAENAFALSSTIKEDTKSGVNKEIVFICGW